ncbi:MAG: hypothetical protein ACR2N5_01735 [Solirubrobacterales bacterium]
MSKGDEERAHYPCPACGSTLYGWVKIKAAEGPEPVLDRCESCGLAVTRADQPVDVRAELAGISRGPGEYAAANRRSWQSSLGEGHWAALDSQHRIYLTPRAATLLFEQEGLEIGRISYPRSGRNIGWMWQTLMNALTLRDNFARDARAGRIRPEGSRQRTAYGIDMVVTVLAAIPVTLLTGPLELLAALFRRGGEMVIQARPMAMQPVPELDDADELAPG